MSKDTKKNTNKNTDQYKVAIIGPAGVITGFSALGAVPHAANDADEAQAVMRSIVEKTQEGEESYAVVMVIEDLLRGIPEKEYKSLTKNVLPTFVAVPGTEGATGYMNDRLREYTVRAIGSDIM